MGEARERREARRKAREEAEEAARRPAAHEDCTRVLDLIDAVLAEAS